MNKKTLAGITKNLNLEPPFSPDSSGLFLSAKASGGSLIKDSKMRICKIDGCGKKHMAKGFCVKHYNNFLKQGNPLGKFNGDREARFANLRKCTTKYVGCKVDGCNSKHYSLGYCRKHQANFVRCGNPLGKTHKCLAPGCNTRTSNLKYCAKHSKRNSLHRSLDLNIKYTIRGSKNPRWNGGVSEYPNHYQFKKNRLIVLLHNPKCEICGRKATQVHHKDGTKTNHELSNLMAVCVKCHPRPKNHKNNNSKEYGMNLFEISKISGLTYSKICRWNKDNRLKEFVLSNPEIFLLDKTTKVCL